MAATTTQPEETKVTRVTKPEPLPVPDGYLVFHETSFRRSTGTAAAAFRPVPRPFLVVCEHGSTVEVEKRNDVHATVTYPEKWCKECKKAATKRARDAAKAAAANGTEEASAA
jgi:hypothetical protein